MDAREKDIQSLCQQVIGASPVVHWSGGGPDTSTCPFCGSKVYYETWDLSELAHEDDCAFLIAKDLSSGIKVIAPPQTSTQ